MASDFSVAWAIEGLFCILFNGRHFGLSALYNIDNLTVDTLTSLKFDGRKSGVDIETHH
jgi:hypothetical protein